MVGARVVGGRYHRIAVKGWDGQLTDDSVQELTVPSNVHRAVSPGQTRLMVVTQPGRLLIEWVSTARVIDDRFRDSALASQREAIVPPTMEPTKTPSATPTRVPPRPTRTLAPLATQTPAHTPLVLPPLHGRGLPSMRESGGDYGSGEWNPNAFRTPRRRR